MKETRDIIYAYDQAIQKGLQVALATVVKVEGSSYRQPGARMLVTEGGILTGAISGGCLEGDALRKALLCINQKQNKLITYDTSNADDAEFGVQLGCNGIVHILFEYIDSTRFDNPIQLLRQVEKERMDALTLTVFSIDRNQNQPGTILVCQRERPLILTNPTFNFLVPDVHEIFDTKISCVKEIDPDNQLQGLFQFHMPEPLLVIAGAGNDVRPLVSVAAVLGWQIVVADGRASHAKAVRFPEAISVLNLKASQVVENMTIDSRTFFLLMTHNYQYDLALLKDVLPTNSPYIGILGPKSRYERMEEDLRDNGITLSISDKKRIHCPIGLDIGAETAEEIAISIISEIQAFLNQKSGKSLKFKEGKIHNEKLQEL